MVVFVSAETSTFASTTPHPRFKKYRLHRDPPLAVGPSDCKSDALPNELCGLTIVRLQSAPVNNHNYKCACMPLVEQALVSP